MLRRPDEVEAPPDRGQRQFDQRALGCAGAGGVSVDTVEQLREALRWALAELNGATRYDNYEQRENCFALAESALAASATTAKEPTP